MNKFKETRKDMRAEDAEGHGAASEEADGERPYEKPMDVEECACELKKNERGKISYHGCSR